MTEAQKAVVRRFSELTGLKHTPLYRISGTGWRSRLRRCKPFILMVPPGRLYYCSGGTNAREILKDGTTGSNVSLKKVIHDVQGRG